jgi:hypothetical protein
MCSELTLLGPWSVDIQLVLSVFWKAEIISIVSASSHRDGHLCASRAQSERCVIEQARRPGTDNTSFRSASL